VIAEIYGYHQLIYGKRFDEARHVSLIYKKKHTTKQKNQAKTINRKRPKKKEWYGNNEKKTNKKMQFFKTNLEHVASVFIYLHAHHIQQAKVQSKKNFSSMNKIQY
jgi:hypothetical protein